MNYHRATQCSYLTSCLLQTAVQVEAHPMCSRSLYWPLSVNTSQEATLSWNKLVNPLPPSPSPILQLFQLCVAFVGLALINSTLQMLGQTCKSPFAPVMPLVIPTLSVGGKKTCHQQFEFHFFVSVFVFSLHVDFYFASVDLKKCFLFHSNLFVSSCHVCKFISHASYRFTLTLHEALILNMWNGEKTATSACSVHRVQYYVTLTIFFFFSIKWLGMLNQLFIFSGRLLYLNCSCSTIIIQSRFWLLVVYQLF